MMWEKVKIKTISKQIRGVSYSPKDVNDNPKENYSMLLRANNVTDDGIKLSDKVYVSNECISDTQKLQIGDILIVASSGSKKIVGRAAMVEDELNASFGAFCKVIRPNDKINHGFLSYYFRTLEYRNTISDLSAGANINNLRNEDLDNLEIPLPPLPIQKRIAEILDTADALRRKDKILLKKYDELAQAIFIDMFGDIMLNEKNYPIFEFGKLCEELFLGLTSKVDYVDSNGVPLIRATDINKGELSFKNVKFISKEQHKKLTARRITRRGDILISKSGTLGTCAIVDTDEEFSTYESIFTVRPKKKLLNNVFLVSLVRNPSFQEKLLGGKVGAGVAHLNLNMLRDFTLPLPPIELQDKFESISNSIENLVRVSNKSKTDSESLFNSLIQKAFNGELVL